MVMNSVAHPSFYLQNDWIATIRNYAPAAEKLGVLHPAQLDLIYRQQWFKFFVPAMYSGLETPLPEMVRIEESLSWADGSLGWVVTLCSGAGWFGGFLPVQTAALVFKNTNVCLAGSGAAGGTAAIMPNGYLINGTWQYASGAHHATHITANCAITKNGEALLTNDGEPLILPFIFDKAEVTILPAWKYTGMVATGSDAFEITGLEVDASRCFKIAPEAVVVNSPLYNYPFLQLAEATLAVNLSGMAINFMDLCRDIFIAKLKQPRLTEGQKKVMMAALEDAELMMDTNRGNFYEALDASWRELWHDQIITDNVLSRVSSTSRQLAKTAITQVDKLYPLCGLAAASTDTEINRAWRNLHTASQHALLTFAE